MKKILVCFYLIAFLSSNNILCAQEISKGEELYQKITIETLNPYFEALKNGDVNSIKMLISGRMYEKYKVLLEKNKDYPQFLRDYYWGAEFRVEKVERVGRDISVSVAIKFPDHGTSNSKFLLRKKMDVPYPDVIGGRWKIVKQLSE